MTASIHPQGQTGQFGGAMSAPFRQACAVRLIDRRTGLTHRVNGSPLLIFTRNPAEAVADLLEGRDASVWETRVEALGEPS
jgi:hypothetical protein